MRKRRILLASELTPNAGRDRVDTLHNSGKGCVNEAKMSLMAITLVYTYSEMGMRRSCAMIYVEIALSIMPIIIFGLIVKSHLSAAMIRRAYLTSFSLAMVYLSYAVVVNVGLLPEPVDTSSWLIGNNLILPIDCVLIVFLYLYIHTILPQSTESKHHFSR
ncbi:hypothetical protein OPW19_06325 [Vibrio europaeus]|uniref:hypothetical protein n=1 Tax=Vibrio europaeus TaxID=300876 RepID=UPI00233EC826|nr:hypothetical protein [Vibrio europaeus]MDC5819442.1 hypothetical protein [Vibrio europaeus]MDC5872006.1 hypothetical protein [Vibrio europaeus]